MYQQNKKQVHTLSLIFEKNAKKGGTLWSIGCKPELRLSLGRYVTKNIFVPRLPILEGSLLFTRLFK